MTLWTLGARQSNKLYSLQPLSQAHSWQVTGHIFDTPIRTGFPRIDSDKTADPCLHARNQGALDTVALVINQSSVIVT